MLVFLVQPVQAKLISLIRVRKSGALPLNVLILSVYVYVCMCV